MTEPSSQPAVSSLSSSSSSCAEIRNFEYDEQLQDLSFMNLDRETLPFGDYCWRCRGTYNSKDNFIHCFDEQSMLLCCVCKRCLAAEQARAERLPTTDLNQHRFVEYVCNFCPRRYHSTTYAISHIQSIHMKPYFRPKTEQRQRLLCPCKTCPHATADNALSGPEMRRHIWKDHMLQNLSNLLSLDQLVQMATESLKAAKLAKDAEEILGRYTKPRCADITQPRYIFSCFADINNTRKGDISPEEWRVKAYMLRASGKTHAQIVQYYRDVEEMYIARHKSLFAGVVPITNGQGETLEMSLEELQTLFLAAFKKHRD